MTKKCGKNNRGSALVVSLMVLSIILISALGITLTSLKERKASIGSAKSNKAYQKADIGIEKVMWAITRGNHAYIKDLDESVSDMTCSMTSGLFEADGYNVELLDNLSQPINCQHPTELVSNIAKIKSIGIFSDTKRAVEALVLNKTTNLLMHFNELTTNEEEFIDDSYFSEEHNILKTGVAIEDSGSVEDFAEPSPYAVFPSAGSNYLTIKDTDTADDIDFNFTDKDFTIEAWVKIDNAAPLAPTIISQWKQDKNQFGFFYNNNPSSAGYQKLGFQYCTTSGSCATLHSNVVLNFLGHWKHIVVERKSGYIYFFVNGDLVGTKNIGTNEINNLSTQEDIYIGGSLVNNYPSPPPAPQSPSPWWQFRGDMDELRITKGMARYPEEGFNLWDIEYARNN